MCSATIFLSRSTIAPVDGSGLSRVPRRGNRRDQHCVGPRLPLYRKDRGVIAPALRLSETEASLAFSVGDLYLPSLPHPCEQFRRRKR